jgi:uncharacterized membrane-anchored protein YitT (DUF2179 family)
VCWTGRGLTVFPARGGYTINGASEDYEVLYTVIARLEISKLYWELDRIDPKAFVVMNSINDTRGGMIKKQVV